MKCWSCQKEILNNAEFCPHCEAEVVAEPSTGELAFAAEVLGAMGPDLISELYDALAKSDSGEDFVN